MTIRRLGAAALVSSVTVACALTPDWNGFDSNARDHGLADDGSPSADGPSDSNRRDAAARTQDADAEAGDCVATGGPAMVRFGAPPAAFCVDRTEVTTAQYKAFVDAKGNDMSGQPMVCGWNATYKPDTWPLPPTLDDHPITLIDWCDAFAFCAWAGKRLCGQIGGGSVPTANATDPNYSQWTSACGGGQAYPYGDTYDPQACNSNSGPRGLVDVASFPGCKSSPSGPFDMSGNAEELEDSCEPNASDSSHATDKCGSRGGSYNDGDQVTQYDCTHSAPTSRSQKSGDIGFRCCGP